MKKLKLSGKLSLNKETITKLNENQMGSLKGGVCTYIPTGCPTAHVSCVLQCTTSPPECGPTQGGTACSFCC
ncbi:MAG TPA: class I lanthipeptide [Bacteroidia bacterium]|nr:class I lanthipeptide [Bacteroidia bacterium]